VGRKHPGVLWNKGGVSRQQYGGADNKSTKAIEWRQLVKGLSTLNERILNHEIESDE
jgi:hypothetical protein